MSDSIDSQIQHALTKLVIDYREDVREFKAISFLRKNQDRYSKLYKDDGTVASLTHRVLMNRKVAHFFCISLRGAKELWDRKEVQMAFADALRQGDTLLIDAICFISEYRTIPFIQEAIAYNIATCSSMLFQINVACSGLGLCNHPAIKQAILDRKGDIIEQITKNWHDSVFAAYVPYLMEDRGVIQAILDARPSILREIAEKDHLVDASILIKRLQWIRDDPDIIEAVRKRILNKSVRLNWTLMKTLKECGLFQQYPELRSALDTHDENTRA
ncbi:MAG: hypothetical protein ACW985_04905, partial [Candidatus Thorarchaeota archaeon]